ncbi:hypothetical protein [Parasitella parasitica]|uniref:Uncharacterized protein n=1 Tax=Parasitella parasitica TaxID=35722 RepID=A0A0B7ND79_9FUNG|nr:hypothetical protein [Parasitella parasitica]
MKSFAVLAITAALATTAVSAYEHKEEGGKGHNHHSKPDLSGPGIQVETRPPVVVVKTVTLTKSWNARPTGKPHWKSNKHRHEDKDEDEEESGHGKHHGDDEDDEESGKYKWKKHGKGGDDDDDEDLHANSLASVDGVDVEAAEASGLADFAAAQASTSGLVSSAVGARTSSIVSRASSAAASASSAVASSVSGAENVRVGGTFVAAAAGIAAYLLL